MRRFTLGWKRPGTVDTIYQVFAGARTLEQVRQMVTSNLWVAPADLDLAATEVELVDAPGREYVLRNALQAAAAEEKFDYVVMDCPPSLSVLTINALSAATEVFIPLQPHFFALQVSRNCSRRPPW